MAFSMKLRGASKQEIEQRVSKAAGILGLGNLLDRYPRQLSGGQRQRVAMGRAIVRDPQVFLFDEPLSNLDAKLRVQMRTEIKELHQRLKTTTVYVTHDQIEAMTMADKIVVMHDGIVEQMGAVDTAGVEPLYTPLSAVSEVSLRLRDDVVTETDQRELNQRSAPAVEDGLFLVPRVVE